MAFPASPTTGQQNTAANGTLYEYSGSRWFPRISASGTVVASGVTSAATGSIAATNVQSALAEVDSEKAPLASPAFTGTPTAPTQAANDNSTKLATTAYVDTAVSGVSGSTNASALTSGTLPNARLDAFGSGDATVAAGGGATTIANDAVANTKLADMSTATIKGRAAAGTGDPEDLTAAQVKSLLAIAAGDMSGFATVATTGSASDLASGTLATARLPAFGSGDVSFAAAGGAGTIAGDAVSNAKLADMANATVKGRNTAGTGDPEDVTMAQLAALIGADAAALTSLRSTLGFSGSPGTATWTFTTTGGGPGKNVARPYVRPRA